MANDIGKKVSKKTKSVLTTIIGEDSKVQFTQNDQLNTYLNQMPPTQWIKKHPFAKEVKYIPIDKIELLLDMIFQQWYPEVKQVQQLAQSICVTVAVHYRHPISKEWLITEGVGAVPLKTDKGASAADLKSIKSDAVATGAPAAKSYAIKDACEHLGRIFGRDLNRKDIIAFNTIYDAEEKEQELAKEVKETLKAIEACKTLEELQDLWYNVSHQAQKQQEVIDAKNAKKEALSSPQQKEENELGCR